MKEMKSLKVGDILYRVDGQYIDDGSETYQGMELEWQQWEAVKATPRGAWMKCIERPYKKQKFALSSGARWVSMTKAEALDGLIARKRRQIAIVDQQKITASETMRLAKDALRAEKQRCGNA